MKTIIINYLRKIKDLNVSKNHKKVYEYLIKNGTQFNKKDISYTEDFIKLHIRQKQCFYNSQFISLLNCNDNIPYYEGFYICNKINLPLEHGWNIKNACVIDTTASKFKLDVVEYFGLHIPNNYILEAIEKNKTVNSLLWDYILFKIGKC